MQSIVELANDSANVIISKAQNALDNMLIVLRGIAKKDNDGKNEMLTNISKFIGKSPSAMITSAVSNTASLPPAFTPKAIAFFNGINEVIRNLQEAIQILDNIDTLGL